MRRSKPRLGQHFLRSDAVLQAILDDANVQPGDHVLEIGPGEGILTRPLLAAVGETGRVTTVELDSDLAAAVRQWAPANLNVVEGDAVKIGIADLGPFDRIVANLPYSISGPILAQFLDMQPIAAWKRMVLLVQKEFGQRVVAEPRTKAYGRISVHAQRHCNPAKVRDVPPGCFSPPPAVDSMVISFEPREPLDVPDEKLWRATVDGPFHSRRKQLGNTLPSALRELVPGNIIRSVLAELGWTMKRPEELTPDDFVTLVAALHEANA